MAKAVLHWTLLLLTLAVTVILTFMPVMFGLAKIVPHKSSDLPDPMLFWSTVGVSLVLGALVARFVHRRPPSFKAAFEQFWVLLIAVVAVTLFTAIIVIALARNPCGDVSRYATYYCYRDQIGEFLSSWAAAVIVLGPIAGLRYQHRKVKSGERSAIVGVIYAVGGSVISSLLAVAVIGGAIYLDQRFALFSLFSGDAGFALLALWVLIICSFFLTVIIASILLWATRRMRPNGTVETDARNAARAVHRGR
jgi:hypothetical protein